MPYREVLICVAGGSPAIITETIYALAKQKPFVHADEIRVITTAFGKRSILNAKLDCVIAELCQELGILPLRLSDESFVMLKDEEGAVLEDIRTVAENERAGDQIAAFLRNKAADPTVRLHCSIAGGRKTLGFFLGSALSFYGRKQDRLYHVLVSPEFENNRLFFYPKDMEIACRMPDGTDAMRNAKVALVELADLPFIKLNTSGGAKTYRELIALGQREMDLSFAQPVQVSLRNRTITIGSTPVQLDPFHLILYAVYLKQKLDGCMHRGVEYCRDCTDCYVSLSHFESENTLDDMEQCCAEIGGARHAAEQRIKWERENSTAAARILSEHSKIKKELLKALDDGTLAQMYSVKVTGKRNNKRYGLKVEKSKIFFEE